VGLTLLSLTTAPAWASSWVIALRSGSAAEGQSTVLPAAPGSPAAACSSSTSNTIKVTWSAVTHASSYSVYQATSAATGPYSLAASGIATTSWTSAGLASGNYWYEVTASEGSNWQGAKSAATGESTVTSNGITKSCTQP
jgi:hypothetical protein